MKCKNCGRTIDWIKNSQGIIDNWFHRDGGNHYCKTWNGMEAEPEEESADMERFIIVKSLREQIKQLKGELKIFVDKYSEADLYGTKAQEAIISLNKEKSWLEVELSNLKKRIGEIRIRYSGMPIPIQQIGAFSYADHPFARLLSDLKSIIEPEKKEELKRGRVYGHSPEGWIVKTEDGGTYLVNFPEPIPKIKL